MSQAGSLGVLSTPSIPTSFTTDSGTANPAANILNILANDTTDNNANGVQTIGSGSTVTSQLTNRLTGTASVTGFTTGDIVTWDLGATPAVYRFFIMVTGRDTGTGDGVGYTGHASMRTTGAATTLIAQDDFDEDEDASLEATADIDVVADGNNFILRLTGVAGQTISYNALITYVVV